MNSKIRISILFVLLNYISLFSTITIDYSNSQVYMYVESATSSFTSDAIFVDTIIDTTNNTIPFTDGVIKSSKCTTSYFINKSIDSLLVNFEVHNQCYDFMINQVLTEITLPVIVDSISTFSLTGNYLGKGEFTTQFKCMLFNEDDTLFNTFQVSSNQQTVEFNLNKTNADSINVLEGNTSGILIPYGYYILSFTMGVTGKSDTFNVCNGSGEIEILIKHEDTNLILATPHKKQYISFDKPVSYYEFNLLGRRISGDKKRFLPPSIYLIGNKKQLLILEK